MAKKPTLTTKQAEKINTKQDAALAKRLKHPPGKIATVKTDRGEFGFRNQK